MLQLASDSSSTYGGIIIYRIMKKWNVIGWYFDGKKSYKIMQDSNGNTKIQLTKEI